jgi:hypothetical protein
MSKGGFVMFLGALWILANVKRGIFYVPRRPSFETVVKIFDVIALSVPFRQLLPLDQPIWLV